MESFLPFGEGLYRTNVTTVAVALPSDLVMALDAWILDQPEPHPTREEAVRTLVEAALRTYAEKASAASP